MNFLAKSQKPGTSQSTSPNKSSPGSSVLKSKHKPGTTLTQSTSPNKSSPGSPVLKSKHKPDSSPNEPTSPNKGSKDSSVLKLQYKLEFKGNQCLPDISKSRLTSSQETR